MKLRVNIQESKRSVTAEIAEAGERLDARPCVQSSSSANSEPAPDFDPGASAVNWLYELDLPNGQAGK
jgi:hypothetical protein